MNIKNFKTYKIYPNGNIKNRYCKFLKPNVDMYGYFYVNLSNEVGIKKKRIHRLLAEYYIPKKDEQSIVIHLDGNKQNNNLDNLKWSKRSYLRTGVII